MSSLTLDPFLTPQSRGPDKAFNMTGMQQKCKHKDGGWRATPKSSFPKRLSMLR